MLLLPLLQCTRSLEQSLLAWLAHELQLVDAAELADGFSSLSAELASGVLLCEVVAALCSDAVPGVCGRPRSAAARAGNLARALAAARRLPGLALG